MKEALKQLANVIGVSVKEAEEDDASVVADSAR